MCSAVMWAQNISGTLYYDDANISGAKIMNITSKSITATDSDGNFKIYAKSHFIGAGCVLKITCAQF